MLLLGDVAILRFLPQLVLSLDGFLAVLHLIDQVLIEGRSIFLIFLYAFSLLTTTVLISALRCGDSDATLG